MPVTVRNIKIGEGIPKICAPITGKTKHEILSAAKTIVSKSVDLAEWRADWFCSVFEPEAVESVLRELRSILGDMPLLFTFRTAAEGGEQSIQPEYYKKLNKTAVESGKTDLIDVELSMGEAVVSELIAAAHTNGVKIIASNHDFSGTPGREEMIRRLCRMQELEADILKIAVMPQNYKDVLELLLATEEMYGSYAKCPMITMAMSEKGAVTRLCGELFGSAVTFGAAAGASAPGQIETEELAELLALFHRGMQEK